MDTHDCNGWFSVINTGAGLCLILLMLQVALPGRLSRAQDPLEERAWVSVDILNMRSEPSIESSVVERLNSGQIVEVLGKDANWVNVRSADETGWVFSAYIRPVYQAWIAPQEVEVFKDLNIQSGVVMRLQEDDPVEVIGAKEDWRFIRKDGKSGWIYDDYLRIDEEKRAWVDATVLNVREEPTLNAPVLTQLYRGEQVYVEKHQDNWTVVNLPGGRGGWVATPYLSESQITNRVDPDLRMKREAYIQKNPHLPGSIKNAIQRGEFRIGMNKEQVIASAGEPSKIVEQDSTTAATEVWIYTQDNQAFHLYFQHSYVIALGKSNSAAIN